MWTRTSRAVICRALSKDSTKTTMSTKHLTKDSPFPELKPGVLRLYSMRFCPYAQRSRLVLGQKQIPHENIFVSLSSKPAWLLERNPNGSVPTIEQDGRVLWDSTVVSEYLDEAFPGPKLFPTDPFEKAKQKLFIESAKKITDPYYKFMHGGDLEAAKKDLHSGLDHFERSLIEDYFAGKKPGMVDFYLWPWFERMPILKDLNSFDALPEDRFPKLNGWVGRMKEEPGVKATAQSKEVHIAFVKTLLSGDPNFDIEL